MIFGHVLIQLPGQSHIRCYLFYIIKATSFQLAAPIFSLGTMAAWRAQRTGYPPPPRSGGRACVNLVSSSSNFKFPTLFKGPRGVQTRAQMPAAVRRPFPFSTQVDHLNAFLAVLVPTCCQQVPKMTPRSPKRAQLVSKIAQNTP